MGTVAVLGAGIAGVTISHLLRQKGHDITLFDKARGSGGRLSSRYTSWGTIDHGTPFFTVTLPEVNAFLRPFQQDGTLVSWGARVSRISQQHTSTVEETYLVPVPSTAMLTKRIMGDTPLLKETRIAALLPCASGYQLRDTVGLLHGPFERVVITAPAPQTAELLNGVSDLVLAVDQAEMACCWVGVFEHVEAPGVTADVMLCDDEVLKRVVRCERKPGRVPYATWQVQAQTAWSWQQKDQAPHRVLRTLEAALLARLGLVSFSYEQAWAHRWLYGFTAQPVGTPCLYQDGIGVCGDWLHGPSVEDAIRSAMALAEIM